MITEGNLGVYRSLADWLQELAPETTAIPSRCAATSIGRLQLLRATNLASPIRASLASTRPAFHVTHAIRQFLWRRIDFDEPTNAHSNACGKETGLAGRIHVQ